MAIAEGNVIGNNNALLWHLPADLKFFKETTSGHHILMGRKTYESIGKPLPNRVNIVLTRDTSFKKEGIVTVHSLDEAIVYAIKGKEEELFIIGGGEIYKSSMAIADSIYLTKIDEVFEGDTFFPILTNDWKIVSEELGVLDEKNKLKHKFIRYEKSK